MMSNTVENQVLSKIKKARRGSLFFTDSFANTANGRAVSKALERLADKGEIKRVATGIYTRPQKSRLFGEVLPNAEEIATAIAKRDKARIVPTGVAAMNRLGLSTQVPMNTVYLTDGATRKIKMGKQVISFKNATPKNLAAIGKISGLIIQALKTIGKDNLTPDTESKVVQLLKQEKVNRLKHDVMLAPEWIRQIMKQAL